MVYLFGIDAKQPDACARTFKERGIQAVVASPTPVVAEACARHGLDLYACVGALSIAGKTDVKPCLDVYGQPRVWFGSGCPNDPALLEARLEQAERIANTPGLAGIFLDGARFASPASFEGLEAFYTCFCPNCVERAETIGMDLSRMAEAVRRFAAGEDDLPPADWLTFRSRCTGRVMARFRETILSVNPGLKLGAFVFAASLGGLVGQTEEACAGFDILAPMLYRCYPDKFGTACLNHEYAALLRLLKPGAAQARVRAITGVDVSADVLEAGFPPEHVVEETRRHRASTSALLAPILQLEDERLAESMEAVRRAGADGVGFFAYRPELIHYLPPHPEQFTNIPKDCPA